MACLSFRKKQVEQQSSFFCSCDFAPQKSMDGCRRLDVPRRSFTTYFKAKLSSLKSSTAQAYATFKDSAPLNYLSRLVIISLPQSNNTATNFALHSASLEQIQNRERHFYQTSPSSPQIWIISLTSVLPKALCTIVLIAGEGKGLFKPALQQGHSAGMGKKN